uniref:Uncharacterized protein n=1 Tax=Avena sativa TaxID=4498 RepID=A0ACD5T6Y2_AVESA
MLHHHSGQNAATGTGAMAAASTFSLFFPPPPSTKGLWPPAEEAYYSYDDHSTVTTTSPSSPASSSSGGSVDCTLSLGTPSSRRGALEPDMARQGAMMPAAAALPWDAAAVAESCYYQQQQGRPVCRAAAGHEQLLDRRCANCGTASTPLWRNGPRGPKSLCNACGIRFKKEERRAAETGAGAGNGGCGFHGAQRAHGSAPIKAPRAASYAEEANTCSGGDPDAPFLAWRLSAIPPAPAFSVWPDRATMYHYN